MAGSARRFSRRSFVIAGLAGMRLAAQGLKGTTFPSDWRRYSDPTTEMEVYRLTDPAYSSTMPAYYNRAIAQSSGWMLFCCDRGGSLQAFHMDLKSGETRQLTEAEELDGGSLALLPDNRSFCYFAGRSLHIANLATARERKLYEVPEGWDRGMGMSVGPDGTHATFAERRGAGSRLRMVALSKGEARTVVEAPVEMGDPIARFRRAQILYRQADEALWLVDSDGKQNRRLKLAAGRVGPANWAPDGKTVLYLNIPDDRTQLNAIREYEPDTASDKLVAKTSQFVHFGFNRDTSVFVGASRNAASPTVLILLRVTRRELTLCEHKASHPEAVAPVFAPDSQRIYFQSDRDGKPAIYCVHAEKLVEKTAGQTIALRGLPSTPKHGG
jgi:oligogalacturonide lyase